MLVAAAPLNRLDCCNGLADPNDPPAGFLGSLVAVVGFGAYAFVPDDCEAGAPPNKGPVPAVVLALPNSEPAGFGMLNADVPPAAMFPNKPPPPEGAITMIFTGLTWLSEY